MKNNKRLIGFAAAAESLAEKLESRRVVRLTTGYLVGPFKSEKDPKTLFCAIGKCLHDTGVSKNDLDNMALYRVVNEAFNIPHDSRWFLPLDKAIAEVASFNDTTAVKNPTTENRQILARRLRVLSNVALEAAVSK